MNRSGSHGDSRWAGTRAPRVLVVDDNADVGESLGAMLRLRGNVVRVVSDATIALDVATRFEPDVILLDLGMPKLDGYEICRLLRKTAQFGRTTIIAVTGWASRDAVERSRSAGFDDHLVKPILIDDLALRIDKLRS